MLGWMTFWMDFKLKLKSKVLRPSPVLCLPPLYLRLRLLSGVSLLPLTMMMMMMMMAAAPHRLPMKTSSSNSPSSRPRDRKNGEAISMTSLISWRHLLNGVVISISLLYLCGNEQIQVRQGKFNESLLLLQEKAKIVPGADLS